MSARRQSSRVQEAAHQPTTMNAEIEFQAIEAAFHRIKQFAISIDDRETDAPWFVSLLFCLLSSCLREYKHLKIGYEKYTGLEAWACRNLLELNIFTRYILLSETNARRFIGDRLIDGADIFESSKEWLSNLKPEAQTPELDETIRKTRELMQAEGIDAVAHLRTRALAAEMGMIDDYRYMNRLCSKLVHPTAWSVLAMNDEGELGQLKLILFNQGVRYGLEMGDAMREHVDRYGLVPSQ
jgi:hypothetical protein